MSVTMPFLVAGELNLKIFWMTFSGIQVISRPTSFCCSPAMMRLFAENNVNVRTELNQVIAADRRRIRQILFDLRSNTAKFTEQGKIALSAKIENGVDINHRCGNMNGWSATVERLHRKPPDFNGNLPESE